jgi:teichuronic acid biosynthesis glycosyltransferase TuaH
MSSDFDLIFVSLENWDEIWRRNQFVCAELARRHPEKKILFVAPGQSVARNLTAGQFKSAIVNSAWTVPDFPNITVTSPLRVGLERYRWGARLNELLARRHIRKMVRRLKLQSPLLWLNPQYAVHLVGVLGEQAVIYDITDDWASLTQTPRQIELIREQDERLCKLADATIVCSERLYDMKSNLSRNIHLIPNGVDAKYYSGIADRSIPIVPAAAGWMRPVLGYTGTLHPDRVDVSLIVALARAHQGSIALIGPNHLSASDNQTLRELGNVHLTGPVPYSEIPNHMAAFDVCITPHHMNAFTESLNPIKLWEYLAAGLPIVSTDVAGFRDYPELVYLANTPTQFLTAVRSALSERVNEGERKIRQRSLEASRHSWFNRVDRIESVIEDYLNLQHSNLDGAATESVNPG